MLFLFKLIILAVIQGIGEVLPISSSGHLIMISNLVGINNEGVEIEILLHIASLVALFFYYFDFIKSMVKGVFIYLIKKDYRYYKEWSYFTTILISTIPVCIIGVFLNNYLDKLISYVGLFLIINGILMFKVRDISNEKEIYDLSLKDKIKIGMYQILGLIPGISRSGSSLLGCNSVKLNKEDSFNLTFLLLFPLVIGSLLLNINDFSYNPVLLIPYVIIFIITSMLTYLSMILLHNLMIRGKNKIFGVYCVSVGVIYSIILLW